MSQTMIFWPMIAHVALVYVIYTLISRQRIVAIKAGNARPSQFRENNNEPAESLFIRNNLTNQFELPVLFHSVCLCLFVTRGVTPAILVFAWLFAVSRFAHAWIHITTNRIRYRRPVFIIGYSSLGILWMIFAARLAIDG